MQSALEVKYTNWSIKQNQLRTTSWNSPKWGLRKPAKCGKIVIRETFWCCAVKHCLVRTFSFLEEFCKKHKNENTCTLLHHTKCTPPHTLSCAIVSQGDMVLATNQDIWLTLNDDFFMDNVSPGAQKALYASTHTHTHMLTHTHTEWVRKRQNEKERERERAERDEGWKEV